jgi:16S rRNA (adenine1518-N6/adenine1519-N6)-dimethyltransferase
MEGVLAAADLSPTDTVVEVGPGLGLLTEALAPRVARLVGVEIDPALAVALRRLLAPWPHVTVVEGDARSVDLSPWLPAPTPYKVVANLPYYAATPILRRFLEGGHRPTVMVVMLQREVAQQVAASQGHMSRLSVGVQVYACPRIVRIVPPTCFYPPPKVTSAVVRLDVYDTPLVPPEHREGFFALVRLGFGAPRKQLGGHLRRHLPLPPEKTEEAFARAGIPFRARPEDLSIPQWESLYHALRAAGWNPST